MFTALSIAMPDYFNTLFCKENSVFAAVSCNVRPFGMKKLWRGLGTTGNKQKQDEQNTHGQSLPQRR